MPSLFPGMDPYLESPTHWADFHHRFIETLSETLSDHLPDGYFARINELVLLIEPELSRPRTVSPDLTVTRDLSTPADRPGGVATLQPEPAILANVETLNPHREAFIEVIRLPSQEVVTVLELLSPTQTGDGRGLYLEKRRQLLRRPVNIVEIDLIRAGRRLQFSRPFPSADYYAFVSRQDRRPDCEVYSWTIRQPLPTIPVPLAAPRSDVPLNLEEAFQNAFRRGRYERLIDYSQPPPAPSLGEADTIWLRHTIEKRKD